MKISKNAKRGVVYILIVVVIVVTARLVIGEAFGSSPVYVVVSKSMVPTLQIGDLVVTEDVPFSSIHAGQIIVFQEPSSATGTCPNPGGLTIVHRVYNVTAAGLITWGDDRATNTTPDEPYHWPPVPSQCVKGLVVLAVPYVGLVSMLIPYPYNYLLVVLILAFVFLSEVRPKHHDGPLGQQGHQ